ncbi:dephospho-CoA kinase/protein folding accessory domain-containing protein [Pseudovibrio sp. Ad13]|uniref:GrpB family protein n=1 Tax=unclassified Pseudovibrio TaxID=2627060 RepID=UPI0007AE9714|nr:MULTISPECIES: GrpB family protein [unclassified Pseudovibrio]KZK77677.1 dephospho-CoA kinase/protein folding accessory domain-containing protein [Pseudovibrio sp. Ad46]KZK81404.1 dephospho-CoA kinase/protein folding accessory domain-containing protein [Pseudovibrio sp. Ad13]KZK93203.1 dephospho-CoA kinase/protein folding accessory domain-containing protein [Pseudovibrio sp. W74]KZL07094.1 dephospho-CoA kinase/protein folding accessory domain-containing protein [Pseudovibrio sp. Ad14]
MITRKVKVVDAQDNWAEGFQLEQEILRELLGDIVEDIHHIGSTSVPALAAKPIIDILLEVSSIPALDAQSAKLINLGYVAKGEYGITGRRYFEKGGDDRTHHLHAFKSGDPHVYRHLAFRDYLKAHPEIREKYAHLKKKTAQEVNGDVEGYREGKNDFVELHLAKAIDWARGSY